MSGGQRARVWKIHPAIGIAGAGNSPTEFFIGSENPGQQSGPDNGHKDCGDSDNLHLPRIKRKAARFRIFSYDASGKCLGEVTADSVKAIHWTVQLANKKASARKIGGSDDKGRTGVRLRNKQIPAAERWKLDITPLPRQLTGPNQSAVFDGGRFMDIPLSLGEMRTDSGGRLLVLGGLGKAGTYDAAKRIRNCTDNDGWYDDVSDGPVSASITLNDGRVVTAAPAWVIVTPPNFAPEISPVATLYDVLADRAIAVGHARAPSRPSFRHDILPVLNRVAGLQWLTDKAHRLAHEIQANLSALAGNGEEGRSAREGVFALVLKYESRLRFTRTQREVLKSWETGDFESDWNGGSAEAAGSPVPTPEDLDRAALESCAGGALFPEHGTESFLPDDPFRLDHAKLEAGALTRGLACPWQADFIAQSAPWSPIVAPGSVLTAKTYEDVRELDRKIAALPTDGTADEQLPVLEKRRSALWATRQSWARDLPAESPAREEALVKEWQHLGFVAAKGLNGTAYECAGAAAFVETERNPSLGSMADYFHRLVNIETNRDFTPKALELALQMLDDAKFTADPKYAPFRYTPDAFDAHLDRIYADFVDNLMFKPVPWESGDITWEAAVDYDDDDEPVRRERLFHVGRFSDRALAERFRQFAPLNLTDGAWLQNILSAGPIDGVQSRLFAIWSDEAGNGKIELNHSNVYNALLHSLNIYMPPVTSREFVEQDFVRAAFESPVFQFCVGLFPRRFLPELLGMTLFVEWEATPSMHAIAKMMSDRHIDPQYYRMHAAIDNINVGHGALAKEAVKLYLHQKREEGGDAAVQEYWQRIWRAYVAWSTLGNGGDDVLERMMIVDKKQIHRGSSLLLASDILPPLVVALRSGKDPVSAHLRACLSHATDDLLAKWNPEIRPSEALLDGLRKDLNVALKAGIYERGRFQDVALSPATKSLMDLNPRRGVDLIDLGRSLLEDAYPQGLAPRAVFPDLKRYHAQKMAKMIEHKTQLAMRSHRRVGWLMDAFRKGPEKVMRVLLERGLVDIDHPNRSRLFEQTEFNGPMYKVFTDEEKATMIDWIVSLREEAGDATRPEPVTMSEPAQRTFEWFSHRAETPHEKPHEIVSLNAKGAKSASSAASDQDRFLTEKRSRVGMGSVH